MDTIGQNKEQGGKKWLLPTALFLIFCVQWLIMSLGPTIYYAYHRGVVIYATVSDVVADENKMDEIYISYEYRNCEYENVYFRTVETDRAPSVGNIVKARISENVPGHVIKPFGDLRYTPSYITNIIVIIISLILCWINIDTQFSTIKNISVVNRDIVIGYAKKHCLFSMVLASSAILLNYIIDTDGAFYPVFALGFYIILRSAIRWIKLVTMNRQIQISVANCLKILSKEEGRDLENLSLRHYIKTDLEEMHYYGYGRAAYFCANLKKNNKIVLVRFGKSAQPHMIFKLKEGITHNIKDNLRLKQERPMLVRLIPFIAFIVMTCYVFPGLYNCNHAYYQCTQIKPSTTSTGLDACVCAICYEKYFVETPKLENTIDVHVVQKEPHYSEKDTVEIDGITVTTPYSETLQSITFVLELQNIGTAIVENVDGQAVIYSQKGESLGTIQFSSDDSLRPGQSCTIYVEQYCAGGFISEYEEIQQRILAEADLESLYFDFSICYEQE